MTTFTSAVANEVGFSGEFLCNELNGGKFLLTQEERAYNSSQSNLLCSVDRYGIVFAAVDSDVFVYSIIDIENILEQENFEGLLTSLPPRKRVSCGSVIRHLGLSASGQYLSVTTDGQLRVFESIAFLVPGQEDRVHEKKAVNLPVQLPSNFSLQWHKSRDDTYLLLLAGSNHHSSALYCYV